MDTKISVYAIPGIVSIMTPQMIIRSVEYFSGQKITNPTRKREIVEARQVAMYLMKKHTRNSLSSIGSFFGKDHATVLHAINVVKDLLDNDKQYRETYKEFIDNFKDIKL